MIYYDLSLFYPFLLDVFGNGRAILFLNILVCHVHILAPSVELTLLQAVKVDAALGPITPCIQPIFIQEV